MSFQGPNSTTRSTHKYHETHKTLELSVHSQAHHHLLISELLSLSLFQYDHGSYLMVEPGDRLIWSLANCYAVYYAPQNIICPAKKNHPRSGIHLQIYFFFHSFFWHSPMQNFLCQFYFKKWVLVYSIGKVSNSCIRDLGFNSCLH